MVGRRGRDLRDDGEEQLAKAREVVVEDAQ